MTRSTLTAVTLASAFVAVGLAAGRRAFEKEAGPRAVPSAEEPATNRALHPGLLHGRVTTDDGSVFEGRLRWGGGEESLWGHYFNGYKDVNPWAPYVAPEQRPKERRAIGLLGFEFAWERDADLGRPLMARFGDVARIEPRGRRIHVSLKSGTEFDLDRFSADDVADGLRVWDLEHGVLDLGEWGIRSIELLPSPGTGAGPRPLHGTVRTAQGDFTGLLQWNREEALATDELEGLTPDGAVRLRFDVLRAIARQPDGSALATLRDGREIALSGGRGVGERSRGVYVDDVRYGRVLISWDALERVDFSPGGTGPAYDDFAPGRFLTGTVLTRSGRRLAGRLVYDLDESETTETLDAPRRGIDYTILFGLIASIEPPSPERGGRARVTLHTGERLELEAAGDLGEGNAGVLVFLAEGADPEYVPWSDVERIDLERPTT